MPAKRLNTEVRETLSQLQMPGQPDIYLELVQVFIETSNEFVVKLKKALTTANAKGASDIGHSWKSSAAAVGAEILSELCKEMEEMAKFPQEDPTALDQLGEKIADEYTQLKAAFAESLVELKGLNQK